MLSIHIHITGTTVTASLFQSSGDADGNSGYVNITDLHKGKVGFGPVDSGDLNSYFVKSVLEMPYKISVIQISHVLDSETAEAPTAEPTKINVTSVLADRGCKEFSHLLVSTGADKTYQVSFNFLFYNSLIFVSVLLNLLSYKNNR